MTKLDAISEKFRLENITRNSYNDKTNYSSLSPDALSNGDDKGKGENNGKIGSATDILNRTSNLVKNTFKTIVFNTLIASAFDAILSVNFAIFLISLYLIDYQLVTYSSIYMLVSYSYRY